MRLHPNVAALGGGAFTAALALTAGLIVHHYLKADDPRFPPRSAWAALAAGPICIQRRGNVARMWHPVKGACHERDAPKWSISPNDDPLSIQFQIDYLLPGEEVGPEREFIEVPDVVRKTV